MKQNQKKAMLLAAILCAGGVVTAGAEYTAGGGSVASGLVDASVIVIGANSTSYVDYSVILGTNAYAYGKTGAIAIGDGSVAGYGTTTSDTLAVGLRARATGSDSIAVGAYSAAVYDISAAFGYGAYAGANRAVAIGYQAVANQYGTVSFGHKSGDAYQLAQSTSDGSVAYRTGTYTDDVFNRLVNVADGINNNDAATYGQVVKKGTYSYDATTKTIKVKTNSDTGTEATAFTLDLSGLVAGSSGFAADQTVSLANTTKDDIGQTNVLKDSDGNVIATFAKGTIASDGTGFVSGADVYGETRKNVAGTYINQNNDVGTNLSALDTQVTTNAGDIAGLKDLSNLSDDGKSVITNLSKSAVKVAAGDNVTVNEAEDADGNKTYTVSADFENATVVKNKANLDASNIGANLKTEAGTAESAANIKANKDAWGTALGGTIASDSNQLVTGATIYAETRENIAGTYIDKNNDLGTNLSALDTQVTTNTNKISTLETKVTENETKISTIEQQMGSQQKLISYDAGNGSIMIGNNEDIVADKVSIAGTSGNRTLTGLKDGSDASDAATVGQMNKAIEAVVAGSTYEIESGTPDTLTVTKDETNKKWTVSAKTGEVSADNKGLVTGDKVAAALETAKTDGGSYEISANNRTATVLNKDGSTAFSLTVAASVGGAYTSGDHINIGDDFTISVKTDGKVESGNTGLVTGDTVYQTTGDVSKLSQSGLGNNLADSMLTVNERVLTLDKGMSDLRNDMHKVGAGAAALAALHPEAYNPNDKLSFAIGLGHYKNANAGAIGAFYKPNQDTTVSFGSTIGNGDPMINIGFSFKLGARSKGASIYSSNVELVREMNSIRKDNEMLRKVNSDQAKEIGALKEDNAQMKAQIAQILKKLELSGTVKKTMAAH